MSVLLRSTGGELYKIWRRPLSKVLLLLGVTIIILGFGVFSLPAIIDSSLPLSNFMPPPCGKTPNSAQQGTCLNHAPTQADIAQAQQLKQQEVKATAASLYLPGSISTAVNIIYFIGVMLLIILAGTIVGGEYNVGSIRIMLTRGPTRLQFLLAKIVTMLVCSFFVLLVLVLVGIVAGALFNLATGVSADFKFLTSNWLLHCSLFLLVAGFGLFLYSVLATCLATLGRSTVSGVAGALIWWFMEKVLSGILPYLGFSNRGRLGDILTALPDYFVGNNIGALLNNQLQYMNGAQAGTISDLHAILVLLAYLAVFIGVAWWVIQARDITN